MNYIQIISDKKQKLSKLIADKTLLNFNQIQKIIRNKDVKVSDKRIGADIDLKIGDKVEIFYVERQIDIVYEDDNIAVVFKPRGLEVINEQNDDLISRFSRQINKEIFAVHRLDRNTEGLVIFAKNLKSKDILDKVFKDRSIEKFYLALVLGTPEKNNYELEDYLFKDEKNSVVKISSEKQQGYELIKTNFIVLKRYADSSLLEVELVTGKTHQIRAHLAFVGFPIIGDEKYGNSDVNKKLKKKYQCLCAYKIVFHFEKDSYLNYLDGKVIEIDKNKIDFCKNL